MASSDSGAPQKRRSPAEDEGVSSKKLKKTDSSGASSSETDAIKGAAPSETAALKEKTTPKKVNTPNEKTSTPKTATDAVPGVGLHLTAANKTPPRADLIDTFDTRHFNMGNEPDVPAPDRELKKHGVDNITTYDFRIPMSPEVLAEIKKAISKVEEDIVEMAKDKKQKLMLPGRKTTKGRRLKEAEQYKRHLLEIVSFAEKKK